ncbi:MAG: hypothetical protein ACTHKR_01505 [Sphingomonas sp.]
MAQQDDEAWFAPKLYGFGSGLPIAWQGWALLGGYCALVALSGLTLRPHHGVIWGIVLAVLTLGLCVIAAHHTRGGWRWRWGDPD